MKHELEKALKEYDNRAAYVGGCGDGGCVVKPPQGQHTNGGCRCFTDTMKAQRMMWAGQRLRNNVAAFLPGRPSSDTIIRVMASLAGAISLLERSPKTAAPSDKMFDQMLDDYRKALDAARADMGGTRQ